MLRTLLKDDIPVGQESELRQVQGPGRGQGPQGGRGEAAEAGSGPQQPQEVVNVEVTEAVHIGQGLGLGGHGRDHAGEEVGQGKRLEVGAHS